MDVLDQYRTSTLFTDAERAALDCVIELTMSKRLTLKLRAADLRDRLVSASEHLYNMTNIGLNLQSDMLCDIKKRKAA